MELSKAFRGINAKIVAEITLLPHKSTAKLPSEQRLGLMMYLEGLSFNSIGIEKKTSYPRRKLKNKSIFSRKWLKMW